MAEWRAQAQPLLAEPVQKEPPPLAAVTKVRGQALSAQAWERWAPRVLSPEGPLEPLAVSPERASGEPEPTELAGPLVSEESPGRGRWEEPARRG
jgi:hypothetical protein